MKVFLSHSSRDAPLLRELRQYLPRDIETWIDELELPPGVPLSHAIRTAIDLEDFVVIFIGPEAVKSEWVQRELSWALEKEMELGRTFVIPVLLDRAAWGLLPKPFQDRKYIECRDFTAAGIRYLAERLAETLFHWVAAPAWASRAPAEEEAHSRREQVQRLAAMIKDDPKEGSELLTKERLAFIVVSLELVRRIELLALAEMGFGRFRKEVEDEDLTAPRFLEIFCSGPRGGRWVHRVSWRTEPFSALRNDYGLGDQTHLVRDVFLRALSDLSEPEKLSLYSGISIDEIRFLK